MRIQKPIGTYSEKQAKKYLRRSIPYFVLFFVLFITSLNYLPIYVNLGNLEPTRNFIAGVIVTLGTVLFFMPYQNYKSGLHGEKLVIKNLSDKLNDEYSIYNDVLLKNVGRSGNIDHIIVGPTGVFVIETKNNEGTIICDRYGKWKGLGENRNPVYQVNWNMFKVKDILKNCEVFSDKKSLR